MPTSTSTLSRFSRTFLLVAFFASFTACNVNKSAPASTSSAQPVTNTANSNTASSAASSDQSNLPDPCTLITKAEAEEILGEPVGNPEPNSLGGNRICDFKTVKVHGGVLPYSIHIAITPEKQNVWDAGKKLHADAKELRPAAGFGDDAYFLLDDLEIRSKDRAININVMKAIDQPNHAKTVEAAEKAVAQKALPRLQ
jgi:hypothetical protein